jgi:hypothetical protein
MDKSTFREGILSLYEFFRLQKPPSTEALSSMFEYVASIPDDTFTKILDQIKTHNDNIPRNLPKAIRAIYFTLPHSKTKITYDKYNDPRFPVQKLHDAFWILENKGVDDFRQYCEKENMPSQDRERVWNKSQYIQNPEFRKKINKIIDNIKNKLAGSDFAFSPDAKDREVEYPDEIPF